MYFQRPFLITAICKKHLKFFLIFFFIRRLFFILFPAAFNFRALCWTTNVILTQHCQYRLIQFSFWSNIEDTDVSKNNPDLDRIKNKSYPPKDVV